MTKWYTKMLRRLLTVTILSCMIICGASPKWIILYSGGSGTGCAY